MPSGRTRTGRKTPNTPGSSRDGVDIARIGKPRCKGDAPCRTARTFRQRRHHARPCAANPHSHRPNRVAGSRLGAVGTETTSGGGVLGAKGW
jgi:hypothetical protein